MCHSMGRKPADPGGWNIKRQPGPLQPCQIPESAFHGQAHPGCHLCCMEHWQSPGNGRSRQTGTSLTLHTYSDHTMQQTRLQTKHARSSLPGPFSVAIGQPDWSSVSRALSLSCSSIHYSTSLTNTCSHLLRKQPFLQSISRWQRMQLFLLLQVTMTRGSDGETLSSFSIKLDPTEVCFAERKGEPGQTKQDSCTISINVGKRNLYLITVSRRNRDLVHTHLTHVLESAINHHCYYRKSSTVICKHLIMLLCLTCSWSARMLSLGSRDNEHLFFAAHPKTLCMCVLNACCIAGNSEAGNCSDCRIIGVICVCQVLDDCYHGFTYLPHT